VRVMRSGFRWFWLVVGIAFVVGATGIPIAQTWAQPSPLVVWWNKGFYPQEDEALSRAVADWERRAGRKVELAFFSTHDIMPRVLSAVEARRPPDVAFSHVAEWTHTPKLAWDGKLEDVSSVVEGAARLYDRTALRSVQFFNNVTKTRAYYAVPIFQQTIHIHYWKDMVARAGLDPDRVPTDWEGFWSFWRRAQDGLRGRGERAFGLGLTMSTGATDTFYNFEQILEAYGVRYVEEDGRLVIRRADVRAGIIRALDFYTKFYLDGYVPPGAITWLDPDNNVNFHNFTTVMTPNPTISIPAARLGEREIYFDRMATVEWPDRPDGRPLTYLVGVKGALVFSESRNKDAAKAFLSHLIVPRNLNEYVKGSLGRWFPVMPQLLTDPYWTNPADPHISVAFRQFTRRATRPFFQVFNPAFGPVTAEGVWGRAMGRVVVDKWSAERAADEAISRIEAIFAGWK
jgi:multiple sugar transport system substrate-binding protein